MIGAIIQALLEFLGKFLLYILIDVIINLLIVGTGECALYVLSLGTYEPFRKELLFTTQWKSFICGLCVWLGEFIELEVVISDSDNIEEGEKEAQWLMTQLGIKPDHLVEGAYIDLLEQQYSAKSESL